MVISGTLVRAGLERQLCRWRCYARKMPPTPRCMFSTALGFARARSLNQIITNDAFHMAESFLTQPLQIVAGSVAGSKRSDDLYRRAASTKKNLHVVDGANHRSLYDVPRYVDEAVSVLAPFFQANL